jgi:hypothetical protein
LIYSVEHTVIITEQQLLYEKFEDLTYLSLQNSRNIEKIDSNTVAQDTSVTFKVSPTVYLFRVAQDWPQKKHLLQNLYHRFHDHAL